MKSKVKVALVKCDNYDLDTVEKALKRGINLIGGISQFAKATEKILLKPNLLAGAQPEKCVTTNPAVFEAVIKLLKETDAEINYGDSPAFGKTATTSSGAGLSDIANKHNIPLANFEDTVNVIHKTAIYRKELPLAKGVLDADGIISLPKFKSHGLTRFTGAVKNQYGCIPGLTKAAFHAKIPIIRDFSAFVVDINTYVSPRLFIMDGIMAMEGNGPNAGDPIKVGCLIISSDPVALDATACRIVDLDPEFVPTNVAGKKAGLGIYDSANIEVVGDKIEDFFNPKFNITRKPALSLGDNPVIRKLESQLLDKPIINSEICIKCGKCVKICPVTPKKALDWPGSPATDVPEYDYSKCIRCFCCQETCPEEAITIKTPLLAPILNTLSGGLIFAGGVKAILRRLFFPGKYN